MELKVSNSLAILAADLCRELSEQQNGVFQPWYIITQTEGMNSWLKMQMADHLGVAANYKFLKPNDIIFKVYQALGGSYERTLSADQLSLVFFRILKEDEFRHLFPDVAAYYKGAGDSDVKRLALARKVADLIDQYQVYRPEMISEWNKPEHEPYGKADWQRYLWQRASLILGERISDRTRMGQHILEKLSDGSDTQALKTLIPVVHIFGLSVFTAYHMQIFSALSKYINFRFYILNPSPSVYWFEDKNERQLAWMKKRGIAMPDYELQGNSLLLNWGKLIQNTFSLFFQNEEMLNAYDVIAEIEPPGDTLLHCIQRDLFLNNNHVNASRFTDEQLHDGSVVINSCYTAVREVEVLYNYLTDLAVSRGGSLSARNVVVMCSDINAYAPYIKAVFSNAPYVFPYSLADENFAQIQSVSSSLLALMQISEGNFTAEEVMQLLDSHYIRARFGIEDPTQLRTYADRANIRFGIRGEEKDETVFVSWKYGLQRLVYGICMLPDDELEDTNGETFYPVDVVEGQGSSDLVRFCHFVNLLIAFVEERQRARSLADWVAYVERLLYAMVVDGSTDVGDDYDLLLRELTNYNELSRELDELLSYDVFCQHFLSKLETHTSAGSFVSGGITFCSLIPMRSIPFEVVAILGMDFDKFPRKDKPLAFDLMLKDRRKGDRNVKENDKHLFLETLMSASSYFYISYRGQDVRDNSVLPPSALVDELLDYIAAGAENTMKPSSFVRRHPLHRFSDRYDEASLGARNYLDDKRDGDLRERLRAATEIAEPQLREISLSDFISFFANPIKAYYNRVLGINYRRTELLLRESELFELDKIQENRLNRELMDWPEADEAFMMRIREEKVRRGELPLKNVAEVLLIRQYEQMASTRALYKELTGGLEPTTLTLDVSLDGTRFEGKIENIYADRQLVVSFSKRERKYLQAAYIQYLFARLAGFEGSLYFVSHKEVAVFRARDISVEEATVRVIALRDLYARGMSEMLCYWPDFHEISAKNYANLDEELFQKQLKKMLASEYLDEYIQAESRTGFFNQSGLMHNYLSAAELLFKPLMETFNSYPW